MEREVLFRWVLTRFSISLFEEPTTFFFFSSASRRSNAAPSSLVIEGLWLLVGKAGWSSRRQTEFRAVTSTGTGGRDLQLFRLKEGGEAGSAGAEEKLEEGR